MFSKRGNRGITKKVRFSQSTRYAPKKVATAAHQRGEWRYRGNGDFFDDVVSSATNVAQSTIGGAATSALTSYLSGTPMGADVAVNALKKAGMAALTKEVMNGGKAAYTHMKGVDWSEPGHSPENMAIYAAMKANDRGFFPRGVNAGFNKQMRKSHDPSIPGYNTIRGLGLKSYNNDGSPWSYPPGTVPGGDIGATMPPSIGSLGRWEITQNHLRKMMHDAYQQKLGPDARFRKYLINQKHRIVNESNARTGARLLAGWLQGHPETIREIEDSGQNWKKQGQDLLREFMKSR